MNDENLLDFCGKFFIDEEEKPFDLISWAKNERKTVTQLKKKNKDLGTTLQCNFQENSPSISILLDHFLDEKIQKEKESLRISNERREKTLSDIKKYHERYSDTHMSDNQGVVVDDNGNFTEDKNCNEVSNFDSSYLQSKAE